jgi:hypothetical protein
MNKESFLFTDRIKEIKSSFIKDGWITVYENLYERFEDKILIYCGIVSSEKIEAYRDTDEWMIEAGSEGKPTIMSSMVDGKWAPRYYTYDVDNLEPFIFSKNFHFDGGEDSYVDIAEEFVLYFKLYENGKDKNNRKFYFIDEAGDLTEVIIIEPNKVKVKLKFLKEYLAIRQVYLAICFDFVRYLPTELVDSDIEFAEIDYKDKNYAYNHLIRGLSFQVDKVQSWIRGKLIIDYDKSKVESYYFDSNNTKYEEFITGYDDEGNERLESCKKTADNYMKITYFKKEVLNKYYNGPGKYTVSGFRISSDFFSLKIDNNVSDYVVVFLVELSTIPYKEQLHWKHFNIPMQRGMSHTYYQTMIEGNWAKHPETTDLFFKEKYESFNKKWKDKFGWPFYKPLSKENEHHLKSLHVPTTNNIKTFCEQVLSLVIITIDSLNEKEMSRGLPLEDNDKGITKLEKFIKSNDIDIPPMIEFLRHLQNLRSGLVAHRFSESNIAVKKAMSYFDLTDGNYVEVAKDIFIKSIYTMNTLENELLEVEL